MDLDEVVDELYGLPPAAFVQTRDVRAKQARAAGDRDLATSIKALRRPTAVAWVANQLARRHAPDVHALVVLGGQLRAAMAAPNGPELRRLNGAQRQAVAGLVQRARALAAEAGRPLTDQTAQALADTLVATLSDPREAAVLEAGRLTQALMPSGFGPLTGGAEAAPPSLRTPRPDDVADAPDATDAPHATGAQDAAGADDVADTHDAAEEKEAAHAVRAEQARQDLAYAENEAAAARRALIHATAALERCSARALQAAEHVDQLRVQLAEATRSRGRAQQQEDEAQSVHDDADEAVGRAEQRLRAARTSLDEIERSKP